MRNDARENHVIDAEPDSAGATQSSLANSTAIRQERERIAREVHDELGQVLTALRMNVSLLRIEAGSANAPLMSRIQEITILIDQAIKGVRNVSSNLRPPPLDKGIVSAVRWLSAEFSRHTAIPCRLQIDGENMLLGEAHSVAIFRIVQESLTNIARHAEADSVRISIACHGDSLLLNVRDDGKGFDPLAQMSLESIGLRGMRERTDALGGVFEITSGQGRGTKISVCIPLPPDEAP